MHPHPLSQEGRSMSDVSPVTPDSDSPEEPQIEPPISADTPDDESSASEIGDVETSPAAEAASPAESVSVAG